jgi:transposase
LKDRQKNQLVALLLKGPLSNGYRNDLWTTRRIVQVIERRMGIHYHYNHVGKLLHRLGWSHQKPERRAIERDEEAIKEWKRSTWPAVKKTRGGWAPTSCSSTNPASC